MIVVLGVLSLLVPSGLLRPAPVRAATFTVTSNADSGAGTLRQAILTTNSTIGVPDVIDFAAAMTITPTSELPAITDAVTIDGSAVSSASGPAVVIDGTSAGGGASGLTVSNGSGVSTIRALRIVRFAQSGIALSGTAGAIIDGNYLGTDGTNDLGNTVAGINVTSSSANVISGNVISGQGSAPGCCVDGFGIRIEDPSSSSNTIAGNRIGTNATGTAALGNTTYAISIGSASNTIGGATPAARNLISGNGRGIQFTGSGATLNRVVGNYFGTNAAGTSAIPNQIHAIVFNQPGPANEVGGSAAGEGNVIAASGVGVEFVAASSQIVVGNLIGVGADGTTALGNPNMDIHISGTAGFPSDDNVIGGTDPGEGNVIANSGQEGIRIEGTASGNSVLGNSIHDNTGLGIDLGANGVTANDAGDADIGPNGLQNFPLVTAAVLAGSTISGTMSGNPGDSYRIEVFESPTCDGSGNGEGQTFLGTSTISGAGAWSIDAAATIGFALTATATNQTTGDTSEFGPCFAVTDGSPPAGTWTGIKTQSGGGTIPGDGDLLAAGTSAPAGPAQFTYGALDPDPSGGTSSPSATWAFYTTAGSDATVSIPWRWTGFHGFASVTVKLEAVIISAASSDSAVTLEQHGPQSCDPCTPPSGGFDYQGTHDFIVQTGDQYGFQITTSNGDTNASLYGQLILGSVLPQDCADAQDLYGATANGRYVIQPQGGEEFSVYCTGMSDVAKDYLSLTPELTGPGHNYSTYAAGGASPGTTVTTNFTKVRFDPSTLRIDIGDVAFASNSGGPLTHLAATDPQAVTSMSYATAMACNYGTGGFDGQANIDLKGTPFAIDDTWTVGGTNAIGNYDQLRLVQSQFVFDPQIANVIANGNCGWDSPNPAAVDPFNPVVGDFSLQLRYVSASAAPPAPVLFHAAPQGNNTQTGIVGRLNAAPGTYTIHLYSASECHDGVLGSDPNVLGTAPVTIGANDQTYFAQLFDHAANTDRYMAISAESGGVESDLSTCVVAQPDNEVWPKAATVNAGATATTVQGWIDQEGKSLWYKFHVDPGAQITVDLKNLPADYDVFLFKDIQKAYDAQATLANSKDLTKLAAEFASVNVAPQGYAPQGYAPQGYAPQAYAPQAYAPQAYAPQAYAPQGYAPQAYAPQGYAPQGYAPQGYAPQGYAPQAYAPQGYAPQAYAPTTFAPQAYASAQVTTLFALAAQAGNGSETILANSWNNTGDFYVRVSGKNGAFSADAPFSLSVTEQSQICQGINVDSQAPITVSGSPSTLILTDIGRMPLTTAGNSAAQKATLSQRLATFATRVNGSNIGVVNVGSDPGVAAMNAQADTKPACPFAKNLVAGEIKAIIDTYRNTHPNTLKYVVLVGDDSVIPFFRYPDQALLGPEQDFVPPVLRTSPSEASLRTNYVLGQDEYGASVVLSHGVSTLPVPDLPVGRLVETASDITTALDGFLALTGGVVPTPKSSLVTGYDFIADASDAIATDLRAGIGTGTGTRHDSLITPYDVSPLDSRSWTATDLKTALATRHDMLFLGGHFSADSALAADFSTTISTADLASVNLTNAIVFSIGCHSGYNTVDAHGIPNVTNTLDFAQALARKQATFIAGTGYQYGDTDFIEYSERIYVEFVRELRRGTGNVAVGDALVRSKQDYLRTTNDLRGLHEKALLESALYGFPMLAVNLPNRLPGGNPGSIVGTTDGYTADPGLTLGLRSAQVTVTPSLQANNKTLTNVGGTPATLNAQWYAGSNGVVTHQNEPALPLEARNVSVQDKTLRGVLWLGGGYTEDSVVPLTGAPATENRGVHTRFASPVFYPIRPWSLNYTDALAPAGGSTQFLLTPVQHRGSLTQDAATRRTFGPMGFKLFYSSYVAQAALSGAPEISGITAGALGNQVTFEARVTGNVAAGVQEVWILYTTGPDGTGHGSWVPLQLTQDTTDTTLWRATATIASGSTVRYLVQAVNGLGLVTMNENYGEYYTVGTAGVQPPEPAATTIALGGPANGNYTDDATFTLTLKAGTTPLGGQTVVVAAGGISRAGTTNASGIATIALPLILTPGTYGVSATFLPTDQYAGSQTLGSIEIKKAPTAIGLSVGASTTPGAVSAIATLTSGTENLLQRTVAFVITAPGGAKSLVTGITDLKGQARAILPIGVTGTYSITASFGSVVTLNTSTVDLTDRNYLGSSATVTARTGRIAFSTSRDGNLEIYRMATDGSGQTRLTNNSAIDTEATWSPDGTKIAFTSGRTGNGDIYVMNADGSGVTRLTTSNGVDGAPVWSPDGTKIAFTSSRDGNFEIYTMTATGGSQTRITNNSAIDTEPAWSPDGSKISFTSGRTGNGDIYTMTASGGNVTRLTTSNGIDGASVWSPDGTRIVFTTSRDGNFEIYWMTATGGTQTRLTNNSALDTEPAYTPDGAWIVFTSSRTGNGDVYLMKPDGTSVTRLTTSNSIDGSAAAG